MALYRKFVGICIAKCGHNCPQLIKWGSANYCIVRGRSIHYKELDSGWEKASSTKLLIEGPTKEKDYETVSNITTESLTIRTSFCSCFVKFKTLPPLIRNWYNFGPENLFLRHPWNQRKYLSVPKSNLSKNNVIFETHFSLKIELWPSPNSKSKLLLHKKKKERN